MAAITPATTQRMNSGSKNRLIARFSTAADGDTWASGIGGLSSYWTQDRSNPSTQAAVGVAATFSSGTFTFFPGEDAKAFDLFVEF